MEAPNFAGYIEDLRRAYAQPRYVQWVLNPWEYDFIKKHMDDGCEDTYHQAFFAQCVRVDTSES